MANRWRKFATLVTDEYTHSLESRGKQDDVDPQFNVFRKSITTQNTIKYELSGVFRFMWLLFGPVALWPVAWNIP